MSRDLHLSTISEVYIFFQRYGLSGVGSGEGKGGA